MWQTQHSQLCLIMAPAAARSTILLLAVVLYSTTQQPFVSGQVLQKLNGEWHDISSGFANFVAGLNQQLLQDVQQVRCADGVLICPLLQCGERV